MNKHLFTAMIALLLCSVTPSVHADDVIIIRLSYKIVLNPKNGARPEGSGKNPITNEEIDRTISLMNSMQRTFFRGYRFERVDPVTPIGGKGDEEGPSKWYNVDFFDDVDGSRALDSMETQALKRPDLYAWNENAINIYIINDFSGGKIVEDLIIVGGPSRVDTHLHEIGHFLNLTHTQGYGCAQCEPRTTGECNTAPGDDEIEDTLPDLACWDRDNIAFFWFGERYSELKPAQQDSVDDVFLNVVSYHNSNPRTRLTELQLDRWTFAANEEREYVVDGLTRFVGAGSASSGFTFSLVKDAVSAANGNGGDIVMIRPGTYPESLHITKPVTLRVTRQGPAVIGSPVASTSFVSKSPRQVDAELLSIPGMTAGEADERFDFGKDSRHKRP